MLGIAPNINVMNTMMSCLTGNADQSLSKYKLMIIDSARRFGEYKSPALQDPRINSASLHAKTPDISILMMTIVSRLTYLLTNMYICIYVVRIINFDKLTKAVFTLQKA